MIPEYYVLFNVGWIPLKLCADLEFKEFLKTEIKPVVWSRASIGSIHALGSGSQIETWKKKSNQKYEHMHHNYKKKTTHKLIKGIYITDVQLHQPVHGIVDFSVHDHGFKHWAFTHHKLDHSVDEREQIPTRKTQLKQTDSDWPDP